MHVYICMCVHACGKYVYVCMYVYVCVHTYVYACVEAKRGFGSPGPDGSCEPFKVDARSQIQVLWKNSKSFWPLCSFSNSL